MGIVAKTCSLVVLVALLSLVDCQTCMNGVLKADKVCTNQCLTNSTCSCMAELGSELEHCKQYCSFVTKVCSDMVCKGGKTCNQFCGRALCNMTCSENTELCIQNCTTPGRCDVIKCSSTKCEQSCSNCTMICTSEVEECKQVCQGESCNVKCAAANCRNSCPDSYGNRTECDVDKSGRVVNIGHVMETSCVTFIPLAIFALVLMVAS